MPEHRLNFKPKIINLNKINDKRGFLLKSYNKNYSNLFKNFNIYEQFYTHSKRNTLRGFHFQFPPYQQARLIHCVKGEILDVIIDIRKKSKFYGKIYSYHLSHKKPQVLYIPNSFAHAFLCLTNECLVNYNLDNKYSHKFESGIFWNSVKFNWPIKKPIISKRDNSFVNFEDFKTPF